MRKKIGRTTLTIINVLALTLCACARQTGGEKGRKAEGAKAEEGELEKVILVVRNMLYCDQTLDEALQAFDAGENKVLQDASARVKAKDYEGAVKLLLEPKVQGELKSDMAYAFLLASAHRGAGNPEAARGAVRPLLADGESRVVLLAWTILRELGEQPPPASAHDVLGVVVEMGTRDGAAVVAGYADGRARFFTSTGGGLIGESPDEKLVKAAKDLTRTAGPLSRALPAAKAPRSWPDADRVRITLLTAAGNRPTEEATRSVESRGHRLYPTYLAAHMLFSEIRRVMDDRASDRKALNP